MVDDNLRVFPVKGEMIQFYRNCSGWSKRMEDDNSANGERRRGERRINLPRRGIMRWDPRRKERRKTERRAAPDAIKNDKN